MFIELDVSAQVESKTVQNNWKISEADTHKLFFSFSNTNLIKNNEYFGKIAVGRTYFCSQLNPQLAYIPNPYMRLQGGIYFRKDFGNTTIQDIQATYTLKLHKNGYSFLFGNLEGNINHQLIEPVFSYERAIEFPNENGLQFKIDRKNLWLDTWIDWELQEYQDSPFQEHITSGLSTKITLLQPNDVFKVKLPVQMIVSHKGGQIDLDTNAIESLCNTVAGITLDMDLSKKGGLISGIRSDNYFVYYKDISPSKRHSYLSGTGVYLNLLVKSKYNISLMTSYWQGDYFMAARGGDLYSSVSKIKGKSNYLEDKRQLVLFRLSYENELLPNLWVNLRYEPYIDLINKYFDEYSYSVYFSYKKDFTLTRVNHRKYDN